MRVCYFSKNSNSEKANYAFRIRNKVELLDDEGKGKYTFVFGMKRKTGPNIDSRGVINSEKVNSFEVTPVRG